MSYRSGSRSRALVLGLSITSMGAQAVVAGDRIEPEPFVDLSGLVAADSAGVTRTDASVQPQGCDPSGCGTAYYSIRDFTFPSSSQYSRYGNLVTGVVSAQRYSGTTVFNAELDIQVLSGAEIVSAPGCELVSPQLATCALGDLVDSTPTGNTVTVKLIGNQYGQLVASLRSPTTNQGTGSGYSASVYNNSGATTTARLTRIEQDSCPFASADISFVQTNGEPAWDSIGTVSPHVLEEGSLVPSLFDSAPVPLSIAFVIDDSAAADPAAWQAAKSAVVGSIQDWAAWAGSKSMPFPAFAIYGMGTGARLVDYSPDSTALVAAVQALQQRQRGSALYATLDQARNDLSTREGRRVAVVLASATDAGGGVLREAVKQRLIDARVNVYGVAIDIMAEPILRDLATATRGFRQRADLDGGTYSALGKINRQIRTQRRASWVSSDAIASYRPLQVQLENGNGSAYVDIADGYTPAGASCSSACKVVRQLPVRLAPASSFVVQLSLPVSSGQYTSIVEQVPYGFNVTSVSNGGIFDVSTRTVSWSVPPSGATSGVSYVVTASSASDPLQAITGYSSSAGSRTSTCGSSAVDIVLPHPASTYLDGYLDPVRLRAYRTAWLHGGTWIGDDDAMIRAAYLTRGFQIARGGSQNVTPRYGYSPLADVPWASNVAGVVMAIVQSRTRALPANFTVGTPFTVTLSYVSSDSAGAGAFEESPPAGWTIGNISDGGVYDPRSRTIRWGVFTGNVNRSVSYTLTPPVTATSPAVFVGRVSVDGNDAEFTETTLSSSSNDVIFQGGFDS